MHQIYVHVNQGVLLLSLTPATSGACLGMVCIWVCTAQQIVSWPTAAAMSVAQVCYCLLACLQIYEACKERGRIAYKRSGGSRLITHNEHWKSQIRHALYTSDRFVRYICKTPCLSIWAELHTCTVSVQLQSCAARWSICMLSNAC